MLLSVGAAAQAQPPKGKSKDFFKIKAPKIDYITPDTTVLIEYEDFPEDTADFDLSIYFNPAKELNIVNEDTTTLDEGEQEIVEISEEILVDSTWIRIAGYYAIWDTRNLNPYRVDARQFKDTVELNLIDPVYNRTWKMPLVKNPVTSSFAYRWNRWHYGTDLDLDRMDSVRSVFDGVVRIVKWDGGGYGNYILVRHYNGLETLYGHLTKSLVETGQFVKAGELIGWGGSTGRSTGPHLHFEVRYEGNPINPESMYDFPKELLISTTYTITPETYKYLTQVGSRTYQGRKGMYYRVKSGDNLGAIARKYNTSVANLCKLNRIRPTTILSVGRRLRVR